MEAEAMEGENTQEGATNMSDRICQFFLRGRCKRDNCEFKHDPERLQQKPEPVLAVKSMAPPPPPSGEMPAQTEPTQATLSSSINESVKDTSTFIAATSEQPTTPLLSRRANKAKDGDVDDALTNGNKAKLIRRDSKGFERFEDYFSDSGDSTIKSPDKDARQQTMESPAVLNDKNLEENVQPPVRDSVSSDQAEPEAQPPMDVMETEVNPTAGKELPKSLVELSKEWDDGDEEESSAKARKVDEDQGETIENIENFIQGETPPASSGQGTESNVTVSEKQEQGGKSKEEWVSLIFGENDKQPDKVKPIQGDKNKSVYDLNPEGDDFEVAEATPFTNVQPKADEVGGSVTKIAKNESLGKTGGLTKIGNNTYFYSGPKSNVDKELVEEEQEEGEVEEEEETIGEEIVDKGEQTFEEGESYQEEDAEEEEQDVLSVTKRRSKVGRTYANGRRRHSTNYVYGAKSAAAKTRRCGECEGCNREDCGKCTACIDKLKFGGKGGKKQACIYRICSWKNPSGKRITPGSAPVAAPPIVPQRTRGKSSSTRSVAEKSSPKQGKAGRKSISVISPAPVKSTAPSDEDLPEFDPETFRPGYTPPVVKKGNHEYAIIVAGVQDTGLCGKYWSDMDNLPSKRRRTTVDQGKPEQSKVEESTPTSSKVGCKPARKQALKHKVDPSGSESGTENSEPEKSISERTGKGRRGRKSKSEAGKATEGMESTDSARDARKEANSDGKKRKGESESKADQGPLAKRVPRGEAVTATQEQAELTPRPEAGSSQDLTKTVAPNVLPSVPTADDPMANRSVSCVASDVTQREVVVECFAPYDDHRWVNIGKTKDGMAPDAVQYARALRPPYHLLSFLRIKAHSTKGMSCTDKNTMVFVVLEGEITVVLHTTQFSAKKGDSFYIPPKNYYNLINQRAEAAELSLIQFQYDGPLPTVAAASQSGLTKAPPAQQSELQ